jgi:hypothetical protein
MGVSALTFTQDGMYLISAVADASTQIAVWDWTSQLSERPLVRTALPRASFAGLVTSLHAHPENPRQIVANSPSSIAFLEWDFGADMMRVVSPRIPAGAITGATVGRVK